MKADTVNMFIAWILSNTVTYLRKCKWHEKQTRIMLMNIIIYLLLTETENIKYPLQTRIRIAYIRINYFIDTFREIINIWILIQSAQDSSKNIVDNM